MYTSEMSEKFQRNVRKRQDRIISTFNARSGKVVTSRMSSEDYIRLSGMQESADNLNKLSRSYLCNHHLLQHKYLQYCVVCSICKLVVPEISLVECYV